MKKLTAVFLSALRALSLAACGNSNRNTAKNTQAETEVKTSAAKPDESSTEISSEEVAKDETEQTKASDTAKAESSNILIAYFSVMETDGEDTVAGASRAAVNGEALGNFRNYSRMQRFVRTGFRSQETVCRMRKVTLWTG